LYKSQKIKATKAEIEKNDFNVKLKKKKKQTEKKLVCSQGNNHRCEETIPEWKKYFQQYV
jgi:hypothetical protein